MVLFWIFCLFGHKTGYILKHHIHVQAEILQPIWNNDFSYQYHSFLNGFIEILVIKYVIKFGVLFDWWLFMKNYSRSSNLFISHLKSQWYIWHFLLSFLFSVVIFAKWGPEMILPYESHINTSGWILELSFLCIQQTHFYQDSIFCSIVNSF